LTLGVRLDVSGTIGVTGGAGTDIFSCTTSSSLDDESLEIDKHIRYYYQYINLLPEMIIIYQWISMRKRINMFVIMSIAFEIFKNTHFYIDKLFYLSRINK
jgi:hypothetical protein